MAATALRLNRPTRGLTDDVYDWGWEYPVTSSAALTQHQRAFVVPSRETSSQFVITTAVLPAWVEPTLSAFVTVMSLKANWDSYGGKRTNEEVIKGALSVLTQIMDLNSPVPSIVPLGDGGVQLEWHRKQQDLEITFQADAAPTFYYQSCTTATEEEGFAADVSTLAKLFRNIA